MEEAETQPDDTATEPDESGTEDHGPPPPVFVEQDVRAADNEATAEGAEPLAPPTPVVPRQWGLADMWVVDLPLHAGDPADTELFLGELAAWTEQDPRHDLSGVYGEDRSAEGDIHLRFEAVEYDGACKFFQFASTRRLVDKRGRFLARICSQVNQRIRARETDPHIRVVIVDVDCPAFRARTRVYSGLMRMSPVPPMTVRQWMQDELAAKVPRNAMGKSCFDLGGKIYKYIWRMFGPPLVYINSDLENAQPSILYAAMTAEERAESPVLCRNVLHQEAFVVDLLRQLNLRVRPPLSRSDVKTLIIAAMGQASFQKFLADNAREPFGPITAEYTEGVETYKALKTETVRIAEVLGNREPEAREYTMTRSHNWVGSFIRRYCNVVERELVEKGAPLHAHRSRRARPDVPGGCVLMDTQHDGWGTLMYSEDWDGQVGVPTTEQLIVPGVDHTFVIKREAEAADFRKVLQESLRGDPIPRTPSGIMPGHEFMWLLRNCFVYF